MDSDFGPITVVPLDIGAGVTLVSHGNNEHDLVVRPYPYQTFEAAVDRASRVLPHSSDRVRQLLRPHFPITPDMVEPQVGETESAAAARRRIIAAEKRARLLYWLIAAAAGIMVGVGVSSLAPSVTPTEGPLDSDMAVEAINLWDVDCSVTDNGWTAACQGDVVGAFTLRGYYAETGVLLSSRVGKKALMMNLLTNPDEASNSFARLAGTPSDTMGVTLLTHPSSPHIVMWGDPGYVDALTSKAIELGYTKAGAPAETGTPAGVLSTG